MPNQQLPEQAIELLKQPNPAVITTVRPDGQPVSVATWYLWEDGRVLLNMEAGRKRLDYIRNDPRVSLTVLDRDSWYTHLSLQGRISELRDDPDLADIDRLSTHYRDVQYPVRDRARVSGWMEIDRWHGWGKQASS